MKNTRLVTYHKEQGIHIIVERRDNKKQPWLAYKVIQINPELDVKVWTIPEMPCEECETKPGCITIKIDEAEFRVCKECHNAIKEGLED